MAIIFSKIIVVNKMENKKIDLRVIKTKKILFETLLDIMKDKTFEQIKVSDICTKALINRSTFYSHYEDKYDLLVDLINEYKNTLEERLNANNHIFNTKEYYMEVIKLLLEHIDENRNVYTPVLINNRNSVVMDILLDVISNNLKQKLETSKVDTSKIPNELVARFYIGAVSSMCITYLNDNKKYSKEEILEYLNKLIPDNIKEL